jgi:hypothetical protein
MASASDPALFDKVDAKSRIILRQILAELAPHLGIHRTHSGADATTFAVVQVKAGHCLRLRIHQDAGVGTEQPTLETVGALAFSKDWTKSPPATGVVLDRVSCL